MNPSSKCAAQNIVMRTPAPDAVQTPTIPLSVVPGATWMDTTPLKLVVHPCNAGPQESPVLVSQPATPMSPTLQAT